MENSSESASTSEMGSNVYKDAAYMQFVLDGERYLVTEADLEPVLLANEERAIIGEGKYGLVLRMKHVPSQHVFALKRIRLCDEIDKQKRCLMDQHVSLKNKINPSPYVVKCYGCFVGEGDVNICMELMDASLLQFYKKVPAGFILPEELLLHITHSVISALQYLKSENIMHRDVKPSNILVSRDGSVKLCDFGICGNLTLSRAPTNIYSPLYTPPERVNPDTTSETSGFDVRSDVWGLGVTLIEVAECRHPYQAFALEGEPGKMGFGLLSALVMGPAPSLSGRFSDNFRDFVSLCCTKELERRPKYVRYGEIPGLVDHPFYNQVANLERVAEIARAVFDGNSEHLIRIEG